MVIIENMQFNDTIGLLYQLKIAYDAKTIQEVYDLFVRQDIDTVIKVTLTSYNMANKTSMSEEDFYNFLGQKNIGVLKLVDIYSEISKAVLASGLTEEEIEQRKNLLRGLK